MNKIAGILTALIVFGTSTEALGQNERVQTTLDVVARGDYHLNRRHPRILGKCWGRSDDNVNNDLSAGTEGELVRDSGAISLNMGQLRQDDPAISWETSFQDARSFSLNFLQNIEESTRAARRNSSTGCTRTTENSKLSAIRTRLASRASIQVPDGTFLLEFKKKLVTENFVDDLQISVTGARKTANCLLSEEDCFKNLGPVTPINSLQFQNQLFVLVYPGEVVDLEVIWETSSVDNYKLDLEVEVFAAAGPECSQPEFLGPPDQFDGSRQALSTLFAEPENSASLQATVRKLSCLRRPEFVLPFLYENHGSDATGIVSNVARLSEEWARERENPMRAFTRTALAMTAVELARALYHEMAKHCQPIQIVNMLGEFPDDYESHMRFYQRASYKFGVMEYYLEIAKAPQVRALIGAISNHQLRSMTYGDVIGDLKNKSVVVHGEIVPALDAFQSFFDDVIANTFTIYDDLEALVTALGDAALNRTAREELVQDIRSASEAANDLYSTVNNLFQNYYLAASYHQAAETPQYAQYNLQPINASALQQKYDAYLAIRQKVRDGIQKDIDWFRAEDRDALGNPDPNTTPFIRDFDFVLAVIDALGSDLLASDPAVFQRFITQEEISGYSEQLLACKNTTVGGEP